MRAGCRWGLRTFVTFLGERVPRRDVYGAGEESAPGEERRYCCCAVPAELTNPVEARREIGATIETRLGLNYNTGVYVGRRGSQLI
jgi:hypothetical protein